MGNHFKYQGDYYVSAIGGNDSNAGTSPDAPFQTIGAAVTAAQAAGDYKYIVVGTGVYNETIAMGNNYGYHTFYGDGDVYLDGAGLTYHLTGYHLQNLFCNFKFVNVATHFQTGEQQEPMYKDCEFRGISKWQTFRQRYGQAYYNYHTRSILVDGSNYEFSNLLTGTYKNCLIINYMTTGMFAGLLPSPYASRQSFDGCIVDCLPGRYFWSGNHVNNTEIRNCVFSARTHTGFYNSDLSNFTHDGSDYMPSISLGPYDGQPGLINNNTGTIDETHPSASALLSAGFGGLFRNCRVVPGLNLHEELSGSGDFNSIASRLKFDVSSSMAYSFPVGLPLNPLGGYNPTTGFGYESSSANPLHPMGGAIWDSITTSSLGGFQIAGSGTGSITSAVIDQGATKVIRQIQVGFTSGAPNAAAVSTHPSGALNHNPTRYQYEMRYGNSADLSGESYKIFDFGCRPEVNINGSQITGSGDQNFDSGSAVRSNVSARYLQLRLTLRTDMSGSL